MKQFEAEIIDIIDETPDVKTFILKPGLDFIPGQYCTIQIIGKEDISPRPFTFSSSPTDKKNFSLTIKKVGQFTTEMFKLKKGSKILVNGPLGNALLFDENIKDNIAMVAGGVGVTPFMSMLRYAISKKLTNKFILFYSCRTRKDIIFKGELSSMPSNIKVIFFLTRENPKQWQGELGRIDEARLKKYAKNVKSFRWYLAGPPAMVNSTKELLKKLGVTNIHSEPWQIPGKN
ncbi:FAD-dependent oxidoreductase [Candidatus Woesearchaeota archaeon]|nr:MAG: FAD-dependent oxidoreductase [Candidatus Woesearchaeota archaeon]